MKKQNHYFIAIHITERLKNAVAVQKLFSQYGCYIKTRLGLHNTSDNYCATDGIVILELLDNKAIVADLQKKLAKIKGIEVKKIVFTH